MSYVSSKKTLRGASGLLAIDEGVLVLGGGGMRGTLHLRGGALALGVGDVDARSSGETMRGGVRGSEVRAEGAASRGRGDPGAGRARAGRRRGKRVTRGDGGSGGDAGCDGEVARHGRDYRFRARYRRCGGST